MTRRRRRKMVSLSYTRSHTLCSYFITDTLPSFTHSSHTKKASNKSVKENKRRMQDSDSEVGFADIFNALNPSRGQLCIYLPPGQVSQFSQNLLMVGKKKYHHLQSVARRR